MSEKKTLIEAFVAAQAEMPSVKKDSTNPHFKNRYASLDAIIETARPVLAKHGLAFSQSFNSRGVATVIIGHGEQLECGCCELILDKQNMQGLGSAITYARRYSLGAALGIATDEDDDGNFATNAVKQPKQPLAPSNEFKDRYLTHEEIANLKDKASKLHPDALNNVLMDWVCTAEELTVSQKKKLWADIQAKAKALNSDER